MGLLDDVLGSMLGNATGGAQPASASSGMGGNSKALMALLPVVLGMLTNRQGGAAASGGGGLGDVLGGMLGGRGGQGGGLGDVLGSVLGGGSSTGGLGAVLGNMLGGSAGAATTAGGAGGLGGLLEQFQRAGFAEQASSWVGTGENLPIPPEAIGDVFGSDALSQIAQHAGVSEAEASEGLSQLLPEVVDQLTPDGNEPSLDQLLASVSSLTRQFGG